MEKQMQKKITEVLGNRTQIVIKAVFGLLYALFIVLGDWDKALEQSGIRVLGRIVGWWLAAFLVLTGLFWLLDKWNVRKNAEAAREKRQRRVQARAGKKYVYGILALVCFLGWLPYFLLYFPGWISNDSVWQLEQVCGWVAGSNHHPYFHTMIIKCFFMLGFRIFGTYTGAVAAFTLAQMVIIAAVYGLVLYDFYRKGVNWGILALGLMFYGFLPMNGLYAICMGKDVLFAAALTLYVREIYRFLAGRKDTVRSYLGISVTGFLVCVLRSNGILVFAGTALFAVIAGVIHKNWKKILLSTVIVLGCYLIYHGPVLNALQVEQPDTIEGLTMPTQHILSAYLNGGTITGEELEWLNYVMSMENTAAYYNPYYFDIIKNEIRAEGNQEVIAANKWQYFKIWLAVGLRNPKQYLDAEIRQTYGYWCFDINEPIYEQYRMAENPFGLTTERKVFSYDFGLWADDFLLKFEDFYNKVWSLGLTTWLMLACMAYGMYRKKSVLPYLPYVMLFLSLLLATPVCSEFRYTYGIFMGLPLLVGMTFLTEEKGQNRKQEQEAV